MFGWFGKVSFVPYTKVSDFAVHLKNGRLMRSVCSNCGYATFPPRADCPECASDRFEFKECNGKGTIHTFSVIAAAPTGFDDLAPYTVAVVDLEEGGRLLGWIGESIPRDKVRIGMQVQVEHLVRAGSEGSGDAIRGVRDRPAPGTKDDGDDEAQP